MSSRVNVVRKSIDSLLEFAKKFRDLGGTSAIALALQFEQQAAVLERREQEDALRQSREADSIRNTIRFPEDVDALEHFMTIRIIERLFESRNKSAIDAEMGRIILPMPAELAASYNATYDPFNLNPLLAAGAAAALKAALPPTSAANPDDAAALAAAGAAAAILAVPAQAALGIAINPQKSLAFMGPELREHNLNLKLSPRSRNESDSIREIIRRLKVAMLPKHGDLVLVYPYEFLIEFNHPEYLFATNRCVLKNLTVQYHNEGQAIYFRNPVAAPVTVGLGMSFMETAAPYREDVESFPSRGVSFKGL